MSKSEAFLFGLSLVLLVGPASRAQTPPAGPITLKGPAMGSVRFDHSAHLKVAAKCEVCHHPSNPEKPLRSPQEACTDCHTRPATPPVTTNWRAAFHNSTASDGLCIGCHRTQNKEGRSAPVQCAECHKQQKT